MSTEAELARIRAKRVRQAESLRRRDENCWKRWRKRLRQDAYRRIMVIKAPFYEQQRREREAEIEAKREKAERKHQEKSKRGREVAYRGEVDQRERERISQSLASAHEREIFANNCRVRSTIVEDDNPWGSLRFRGLEETLSEVDSVEYAPAWG